MLFKKAPPCSRIINPSASNFSKSCRMVGSETLNILLNLWTLALPSSFNSSRILFHLKKPPSLKVVMVKGFYHKNRYIC